MSQKLPAKNCKENSDFTMISQWQFSQWFTIFTWKNENSKSWITCSQLAWKKNMSQINLKLALNHQWLFKKIKFNQKAWQTSYIDMNIELRKKAKNGFEIYLFKLISNAVFRKTMENVRNQRDIQLITSESRRNFLLAESYNNHTTFFFLKIS